MNTLECHGMSKMEKSQQGRKVCLTNLGLVIKFKYWGDTCVLKNFRVQSIKVHDQLDHI